MTARDDEMARRDGVGVLPPAAGPSDGGPSDAGPSDAGPSEAGPSDAGPSDAGPSDAGPSEAGPSDAGPSGSAPGETPPGRDPENAALRERWVLTGIWLSGLMLCFVLVEIFIHKTDAEGHRWLLPQERFDVMTPIFIVYGAYLGGILIAWFTKPFPQPAGALIEKYRYPLALICTIVFNAAIVYLISQGLLYSRPHVSVQDDISAAVSMSKALSFLVAPINLYYFGLKSRD